MCTGSLGIEATLTTRELGSKVFTVRTIEHVGREFIDTLLQTYDGLMHVEVHTIGRTIPALHVGVARAHRPTPRCGVASPARRHLGFICRFDSWIYDERGEVVTVTERFRRTIEVTGYLNTVAGIASPTTTHAEHTLVGNTVRERCGLSYLNPNLIDVFTSLESG